MNPGVDVTAPGTNTKMPFTTVDYSYLATVADSKLVLSPRVGRAAVSDVADVTTLEFDVATNAGGTPGIGIAVPCQGSGLFTVGTLNVLNSDVRDRMGGTVCVAIAGSSCVVWCGVVCICVVCVCVCVCVCV